MDEEIVIEEESKEKEPWTINEEGLNEEGNQSEEEEINNDQAKDNVEDNEKEKDNNKENNAKEKEEEYVNKEQVDMGQEVEPVVDNMSFVPVQVPIEEDQN